MKQSSDNARKKCPEITFSPYPPGGGGYDQYTTSFIAVQYEYLDKPIVDIWINLLFRCLENAMECECVGRVRGIRGFFKVPILYVHNKVAIRIIAIKSSAP